MKTVDECIAGWSEQERERLQDLIAEAKQRESEIGEIRRRSLQAAARHHHNLADILRNLQKCLWSTREQREWLRCSLRKLEDAAQRRRHARLDRELTIRLALLPADEIFRA